MISELAEALNVRVIHRDHGQHPVMFIIIRENRFCHLVFPRIASGPRAHVWGVIIKLPEDNAEFLGRNDVEAGTL